LTSRTVVLRNPTYSFKYRASRRAFGSEVTVAFLIMRRCPLDNGCLAKTALVQPYLLRDLFGSATANTINPSFTGPSIYFRRLSAAI
jgi:hypothetical protein